MNVVVLGGGVTGLTAAWRLSLAGHQVRVLDAGPRPGGVVRSESVGGWLVEAGPVSFQESTPEVAGFVAELGLAKERVEASPAASNRYVARKGGLVALPSTPSVSAFLSTPLLSMRSKLTVGSEAARSPLKRPTDISVAELVRDHFGREVLENLVQPGIGGIYAGDAERLSLQYAFPKIWEAERTVGSLLRAAAEASSRRKEQGLASAPSLISFRSGLQALTDALAQKLPSGSLAQNAEVRGIGPGKGARWSVRWSGAAGPDSAECDAVIAALPAWALAQLEIGAAGKRPLSGLSSMEYAPVASLTLGFRREKVRHALDGFGLLVPAPENLTLLGAIFTSSLFPGRAPAGHVALTVFAGGTTRPDVARLGPEELTARVCSDLRTLVGAEGKPAFSRHTAWPRAIPQYNLGHGRHLEMMAACERAHPGLFIGGNVRDGIALPQCLSSGAALAKRAS